MPSYRGRLPFPALVLGTYLSLLLPGAACAQLPSVASINLCTDQLVLSVADPDQIRSLSWLSANPEESMLAAAAGRYSLNYGSAEELIGIDADIVIAGSQTSPFTRQLLRRLGATIVEVEPAASLADIRRNLLVVGAAIDRDEETVRVVRAMQTRTAAIRERSAGSLHQAVVVRPGGFTIGRNTLAFELLELAGLENSIAELDRWGSLSVEALLTASPEIIVLTDYRADEASLANGIFLHPALLSLAGSQTTVHVHARYFACGVPESLTAAEQLLDRMAAF
ncbi:MAG: ABC transporter substrate-binding protein [Gammaproteobacteria bacterium]|nr:ABC transporter substrate-binding protein [Gammaproteobacteria bacterium]